MIKAVNTKSPLIVKPFDPRVIRYAFHDIDGTHSLIREWPPVMSIVLNDVKENGLPEGYDSWENAQRLINAAGKAPLPETDRFCVESAGLSALTQMEWAIRRAAEEGKVDVPFNKDLNSDIVKRIWNGEELFGDEAENPAFTSYLSLNTPRLFKFYEKVLNGYCRDKNLAEARLNPSKFIVPGSFEFMSYLHENGVKNYFVTGAVVERGMGMFEEVETLGYEIGKGKLVENIIGSTWNDKLPKNVIMERLLSELGGDGSEVLVCGDGRSEIQAGVLMGAVCMSRLPESAEHQREMHKNLGTNLIVPDYLSADITGVFEKA